MILQPESACLTEPVTPHPASIESGHDPLMDLLAEQPTEHLEPKSPRVVPFVAPGDFLQIYGLRENPFPDSVQPAFFFRTEAHAEAYRSMMLAAEFRTSLGLVTGPSGTGKTLVSQLLLQALDPAKYRAVLVLVTPGLSKTGLMREILSELGVALPVGVGQVQELMRLLSNHIMELREEGKRLVLIIDEAHLLSSDCLHLVRTISNIETPEEKLSTCLLFAEARLLQRLKNPAYESLCNRIFLRAELDTLTVEETEQYLKFRLMTVGRMSDLFTADAIVRLHACSGGVPRTMNKLAMLSLIEGAQRQLGMIDKEIVIAAAKRL
jgi:general secretion pathway protein A